MKSRLNQMWVGLMVLATTGSAWAASTGAAPGGDGGGSGSEPETIALILFSLIPGIFFARKAMAAKAIEADER